MLRVFEVETSIGASLIVSTMRGELSEAARGLRVCCCGLLWLETCVMYEGSVEFLFSNAKILTLRVFGEENSIGAGLIVSTM